jgi:hypothetical protein
LHEYKKLNLDKDFFTQREFDEYNKEEYVEGE